MSKPHAHGEFFSSLNPHPRGFSILESFMVLPPSTPWNCHDFSTWSPLPLGNSKSTNKKTSLICFDLLRAEIKFTESEEWSSQLIFQFKQLERRSLKKSGLQRDSNPWPPRYRCDALPTELWIISYKLHIYICINIIQCLIDFHLWRMVFSWSLTLSELLVIDSYLKCSKPICHCVKKGICSPPWKLREETC